MHLLRWRKAIRDLWSNKTRTVLVILSIAVGVFAFGVIAGTQAIVIQDLKTNYLSFYPASAILQTTPFDESLVESVARLPEVALVEGRRVVDVRFRHGSQDWQDMKLVAIEDYGASQVNRVRPHLGDWPPPEQAIVIERNSLLVAPFTLGEVFLVEMPDGRKRELTLAGLSHDMTEVPSQISGIIYGYITFDTLEWLGLPRTFDHLYIVVTENLLDEVHIDQVASLVERKIERSGGRVTRTEIPPPQTHPAEEIIPTLLLILTFLGSLSLLLSGFLVINTISAILAQQTRQIGIMKTFGADTPLIMGLYFRVVFIFCLFALIMAVPLGGLGALGLTRFIAWQINFDVDQFQIPGQVLLLEIVIGLFVPLLAALYPILASARITVREAISSYGLGQENFGSGLVDRLLFLIQKILPISRPLRLSLRNTFRRKGRLGLTLFTLILGGAIFMSVLTTRASLFQTLNDTLKNQGFDVQVQFSRPYRIEQIERVVGDMPDVIALESWGFRNGAPLRPDDSEGDSLRIYAPPAKTILFKPELIAGRWLRSDDAEAVVIHSNLLTDEPTLNLGSLLRVKIGPDEFTWRIIGITQEFQPPIAPPPIYLNYAYFARDIGSVGRTNTLRLITKSHDEATHAQVAALIETRFDKAGIRISSIQTASEDRLIITERFNILTILLLIMSALMAVVGGLGLMGTMSMNVLERGREIGVMRAIGASSRSVLQIFIAEGLLICLLSWAGALILSQPLSRVMSYQIGLNLLQLPLIYTFSLIGLFIWLGTVIIIAGLASFLPAWNASRVTIRETLAYE